MINFNKLMEYIMDQIFKIILSTSSKNLKNQLIILQQECNNKVKHRNAKNVNHIKISEVILIHCNLGNNSYQQNCVHLSLINGLVNS